MSDDRKPPTRGDVIAVWHNDGTPDGRMEYAPGYEPPGGPGCWPGVLLAAMALLLWLLGL